MDAVIVLGVLLPVVGAIILVAPCFFRHRSRTWQVTRWETTALASRTAGSKNEPAHEGICMITHTHMADPPAREISAPEPEPEPPEPVEASPQGVESYLAFRPRLNRCAKKWGVKFTGDEATGLYLLCERRARERAESEAAQ